MKDLLNQVKRFQNLSKKTGASKSSSYTVSINFDLYDEEVRIEWGCYDVADYPRHYETVCACNNITEHMKIEIDKMDSAVLEEAIKQHFDEGD